MSFRQNGSHRYGYVPPAQYDAHQPLQNLGIALQRQPSFDSGDDAPFFNNANASAHRPSFSNASAPASASASGSRRSLYPGQDEYLNGSAALYGQHDPAAAPPQTTSVPTYEFAHAYAQSQDFPPTPSHYGSHSWHSRNSMSLHQPYSPAAYEPHIPLPREPIQPAYADPTDYGSPQAQHSQPSQPYMSPDAQAETYWGPPTREPPRRPHLQIPYEPSPQPLYDTAASYDPAMEMPMSIPHREASVPYVNTAAAAAFEQPNGVAYPSNDGSQSPSNAYPAVAHMPDIPVFADGYDADGYGGFVPDYSAPPSTSNPLPPLPTEETDGVPQLQRHPTGRRLPVAPVDEEADSYDDDAEARAQEEIYQDIVAHVGPSPIEPPVRPPNAPMSADLLDDEFDDIRQSRMPDADPAADATTPTGPSNSHHYDFDDGSDAEAAGGLEAIRIAEEQESRRGSEESYGSYGHWNTPQAHRDGSSDFGGIDLSNLDGGYPAMVSYEQPMFREMRDQPRPLPSEAEKPHEPAAGLGGLTDYPIPSDDLIHPFPTYTAAGTGGLQRANSERPRGSFETDERGSLGSAYADSRRARSGSDSPAKDGFLENHPDAFFHPSKPFSVTRSRPLPTIPQWDSTTTPPLDSGGQPEDQQESAPMDPPWFPPEGPDSYAAHDMLDPWGQTIPRSASLSSYSNRPLVVPPARSKTDAEERQARQVALREQGIVLPADAMDPALAAHLDLPSLPPGRRKKITAENIRSSDYKKCEDPWALSAIAAWTQDMCGGELGEVEGDLREKTVAELLVALFTHKVPTMSTANAEVISATVISEMLRTGVLVPDEEWVKFGDGTISGVLYQMTGSGCYAPRVHEHDETYGRCYSHHCHRTLKKINLQAQRLEPARRALAWHEYFKLSTEQLQSSDKKEVLRQNNLHEVVMSEDKYMTLLDVLRVIYRDSLMSQDPPIVGGAKLPRFVELVFGNVEAVKNANMTHLLIQLKSRQQEQGPWVEGFSDIFREWIRRARLVYLDYAAGYPTATSMVRKEAERNVGFRHFLEQAQANKSSDRLGWDTYMYAPLKRMQQYTLLLREIYKHSYADTKEKANLRLAIEEVNAVVLECDAKVDEENKKVEMAVLESKLFLRPDMKKHVELHLDHLGRELIYQGDLQRAGANRFTWLETRVILFDHYLVLSKVNILRDNGGLQKKEVFDISKLPIPMQLLTLESTNDEPVIKSSMKGLGAVTTVTRSATEGAKLDHASTSSSQSSMSRVDSASSSQADARSMYPFRVKHLGKSDVYTLYAPTASNRQEWCEKILYAKERHAASLFAQNAEPFHLRILADSAFATDPATSPTGSIPIRGTPLGRALKMMEREYGNAKPAPVCRAQVNCATTFHAYGKTMIAIGTDYGVFTSEVNNPREWSKSIYAVRVSQIAVLEEFAICLIISDKSLIAYHLDFIVPASNLPASLQDSPRRAPQKLSGTREVSFFATANMKERTLVFYKKREGISSTFKVLEPICQKSSEKKSRLFGRGRVGSGNTEFFREFDEFYIPADCFTINLFHTYIAISTARGFEMMTLDKKSPISIPDLRHQDLALIARRLTDQKPLGMFRLGKEFLLCFEECGVYVDEHGDVSRSVVLEFVGKAKLATMHGAYLVLFDNDFVEVRNAQNGRLRQIIAGQDVRCLDPGAQGSGVGALDHRLLKVAMVHPENPGVQLVVEMVLNGGQME